MANVGLICLAFAFVFACFLAFGIPKIRSVDVLGLVLVFWIASELIGAWRATFTDAQGSSVPEGCHYVGGVTDCGAAPIERGPRDICRNC